MVVLFHISYYKNMTEISIAAQDKDMLKALDNLKASREKASPEATKLPSSEELKEVRRIDISGLASFEMTITAGEPSIAVTDPLKRLNVSADQQDLRLSATRPLNDGVTPNITVEGGKAGKVKMGPMKIGGITIESLNSGSVTFEDASSFSGFMSSRNNREEKPKSPEITVNIGSHSDHTPKVVLTLKEGQDIEIVYKDKTFKVRV
jgi:hypothetical protein